MLLRAIVTLERYGLFREVQRLMKPQNADESLSSNPYIVCVQPQKVNAMKILRIAPALLMLLAALHPGLGQEKAAFQIPETAAGKLIKAYLQAYNAPDTAAIHQFWECNCKSII